MYTYTCIGGIYWGQNPREPTPSVALNIGITHTTTTIYTYKYKQEKIDIAYVIGNGSVHRRPQYLQGLFRAKQL